ncbi:MAG: PEP-CTERM sorting domain-containing protein [Myxococcota bacterium]
MASRLILIGCVVFLLAVPAGAIVIDPNPLLGTPDPASAPPPGSDPGWDHVGTYGSGSAVYLGKNASGESWILTAAHTGSSGSFTLGGTTYATDASVGFTNPGGGTADLRAWRLVGDPGLAGLSISASTPLAATAITVIGHGNSTGAATCWDAGWNAGSCLGAPHSGYLWASGAKQWGTNLVSPASAALDTLANDLGLADAIFATGFDDASTVLESQAAVGDSGGGAFVNNGGQWELAGLTLAIGWIPNDPARPSSIAALGEDFTYYVDLSFYRDQIQAGTGVPVPEPGTGLLLGLGLVALSVRRRR